MKSIAMISLLLLTSVVHAGDPAKAVRQVLDDQAVAWNKGDLFGFMAGYWKSDDLSFYSQIQVFRELFWHASPFYWREYSYPRHKTSSIGAICQFTRHLFGVIGINAPITCDGSRASRVSTRASICCQNARPSVCHWSQAERSDTASPLLSVAGAAATRFTYHNPS